ncbi:YibE/F family protein [Vibrio sp. V27_P1S3P104]|uniref:YibE/F family protein n=1 Tax=unclassified Vibrio TaxID=2614977 RepID=UPI0013732BD9|nr:MULTISPECIES: YibE/F family protein [unclassified Vibrio]NAW69283.1 YibE/F family protein [Vibrio sp. V28_P6S34P95]NAX04042.1 YibE/F family protein [Vibrio sp. V30_P3S12P165]NAX35371.1 YibE/F family protein [Vibrio sp. V29_P1S30P107]NAX38003.1 YibE/F family protein [Vibrio sp. V27_P1S3P104]NAX39165.1 YibE/F family protein [Vibrio sp. V26_P1S5P106]
MRGIYLAVTVLLCFVVYEGSYANKKTQPEHVATVLACDNSQLTVIGSNRIGTQILTVELKKYPGKSYYAFNLLTGTLEYDEFYQSGDTILVAIQHNQNGQVHHIKALSHYRLPYLMMLFAFFAIALLTYARHIGLRALLSFVGSVLIIWQLLIPGLVAGYPPILITTATLIALSALIIFSIAGWTNKGKAAFAGTLIGLMITALLCLVCGQLLRLDGMAQPMAQLLLFETGMYLNMLDVLYAAVLIGASGAAMDVAMEMAATMEELKLTNPDMNKKQLLRSGFRVGNAVIGTMTTTLLLAYSGGFLTLLMLFISRETSLMQIFNMKLIASEVARTLIGSLSLVIVAPLTACIANSMMFRTQLDGQGSVSAITGPITTSLKE